MLAPVISDFDNQQTVLFRVCSVFRVHGVLPLCSVCVHIYKKSIVISYSLFSSINALLLGLRASPPSTRNTRNTRNNYDAVFGEEPLKLGFVSYDLASSPTKKWSTACFGANKRVFAKHIHSSTSPTTHRK